MRTLEVLIIVLLTNIVIAGQADLYESQKEYLDNILLNGNLIEIEDYFQTQDSLHIISSILNVAEDIQEYNNFKNKYILLINKIRHINSKPANEIKESYSCFIPSQFGYKNKLHTEIAIKAFEKFKYYYNKEEYYDAAKFINITFFLNYEKKVSSLNEFQDIISEFSKEISKYESSIDCGDLDNAILLESKLDSLFFLLPESSKKNNGNFLLLKEKLEKEKVIENNLLCSIIDQYTDPDFSFNIGVLLNHSSEIYISLDKPYLKLNNEGLGYFYNIPANTGLGLSLSFNIRIIESVSVGIELGYFKSYYQYTGVFVSSYNDDKPKRYSKDFYGYDDLIIEGKLYNIYAQYKFTNRTIFHPFVRLAYGEVQTLQSLSSSLAPYAPKEYYNKINKAKMNYTVFKPGAGIEMLPFISNKFTTSLLYSYEVRLNNSELSNITSGTFEIIFGYNW